MKENYYAVSPDMFFWIAGISLVITSITAIGTRALREFSRHELEILCRKYKSDLKFSEILRYDDQVAVSIESLNVATTAIFVTASSFFVILSSKGETPQNWSSFWWSSFWVSSAVAALALMMCKIWFPWAVVRLWATPILFYTWQFWRRISQILTPFVLAARCVDTIMHRLAGRPQVEPTEDLFEEEIRSIVSEGHREGLLEEDAREMIQGVMELSDVDVAKVMTPRTDVVMMSVELSWDEIIHFMIGCAHTRIPVHGKTRDDIVGILYVKDLLPLIASPDARPLLREVLRTPYYVPETKRLDNLLTEFQQTHNHMALVLDEYGGVSGLVSIEDVLEEIVGDIVDEYDKETEEEFQFIDDQTVEILARVHLDEINEQFDLEIPEDGDYDTIGGFVFSQLGHIPMVGEEVYWGDVRIEVTEASRRRIERVQLQLPKAQLPEDRRDTA
jgi:CBS domain containing-hemolysin-like protein